MEEDHHLPTQSTYPPSSHESLTLMTVSILHSSLARALDGNARGRSTNLDTLLVTVHASNGEELTAQYTRRGFNQSDKKHYAAGSLTLL